MPQMPKPKVSLFEHDVLRDEPFNVSFEEMDIEWDSVRNCFVVGVKKKKRD
jgi:hypothetical protein